MKKLIPILVLCSIILSGCSTSYLKTSTNVSQTKKSYDKIVVIARAKDKTTRITFENQLANDLSAMGVNASTSIEVINTNSLDKKLSEKELEMLVNSLKSNGYDGVIVTNLIDVSQYTDITPGGVGTTYYPARYGRFGRYYRYYPVSYWEADQVEVGVEYTLESCLYDLRDEQGDNLQWIGRFQIKNPSNLIKTINKYSEELTAALIEQSISN